MGELSGMVLGGLMKKAVDAGVELGDADDKKAVIEILVAELVKKEAPAVQLPPELLASHLTRVWEETSEDELQERVDETRSLMDRFKSTDGSDYGPDAFSTGFHHEAVYFCHRLPGASGTPATEPSTGGAKRHRKVLRDNISYFDTEVLCRLAARAGVAEIDPYTWDEIRGQSKGFLESLVRDAVTFSEHARRRALLAVDVCHAIERQGRALVGLGLAAEVGLPNTVPPAHHMDWAAAVASATDDDGDDKKEVETDAAVYASLTREDGQELEEP